VRVSRRHLQRLKEHCPLCQLGLNVYWKRPIMTIRSGEHSNSKYWVRSFQHCDISGGIQQDACICISGIANQLSTHWHLSWASIFGGISIESRLKTNCQANQLSSLSKVQHTIICIDIYTPEHCGTQIRNFGLWASPKIQWPNRFTISF